MVQVRNEPDYACVAGLEALAELSMTNPPGCKVRVIYGEDYGEIVTNADQTQDENLVELQVWEYDSTLFTKTNLIEIGSLYTLLQDEEGKG